MEQHALLGLLQRGAKGEFLATLANAVLILLHDPPLVGTVGFDEFSSEPLLRAPMPPPHDGAAAMPGPYPRVWEPADVAMALAYLQRVWSSRFSRATVEDAMEAAAAHRRFHPVRDWLATLRWDGAARLDTWLLRAFGCPDDAYHRAVGAKFLIAAVRRVRQPGCKFDHMLVLQGPQGLGKSTVLQVLFGPQWFADTLPPDLADRDAANGLQGLWCIEFPELAALLRAEAEDIKAFVSRQVDRYRPQHGRRFVSRPRQAVLAGTTNDEEWLSDSTGNRRFWPVRCAFAEVAWVAALRTQLWAEAALREAAGEVHWLDLEETQVAATREQATRTIEDPWTDRVRQYLWGRSQATTAELLERALDIPTAQRGRREQMRMARLMRAIGWRKVRDEDGRWWERDVPGEAAEPSAEVVMP